MYLAERGPASGATSADAPQDRAGQPGRATRSIPGTVIALGTVSLITDVSSEMVTAVLPLYVVAGLGLRRPEVTVRSAMALLRRPDVRRLAVCAALIGTGQALARFCCSPAFGAAWTAIGDRAALMVAAGALAICAARAAYALRGPEVR
ncbi:hypothetical protein N5079_18875 [Planotetraspora sp. A-T 1434]|uniref:hypothetical protein n=1 Tax=Planotetraspora sp. A-T 1434 TaxID=2979219 RepID=UPI0021BF17BF|nr:hypothetical protein [Planotetraspora sp. A-T 1434]MCT9932268.1 hypothetical protein [Planotetraspora sp. A-T 1434]